MLKKQTLRNQVLAFRGATPSISAVMDLLFVEGPMSLPEISTHFGVANAPSLRSYIDRNVIAGRLYDTYAGRGKGYCAFEEDIRTAADVVSAAFILCGGEGPYEARALAAAANMHPPQFTQALRETEKTGDAANTHLGWEWRGDDLL